MMQKDENYMDEFEKDIYKLNNRKVKVYNNSFKKKSKLKKITLGTISAGLSIALAAGCINYFINNKKDSNYFDYSSDINSEYSYGNEYSYENGQQANYVDDSIAFEIIKGEDPVINKNYPNVGVNVKQEQYNQYINYIKSLDSNYKYENLYGINEAVTKYKNNDVNVAHKYDITNGTGVLSADTLYNKVLQNNKIVLADTGNLTNSFYEKLPDQFVYKVCQLVVEAINAEINDNPDINSKEVYCILNNLKVLGHVITTANAYYNEDDVLVVDKENIEHYQNLNQDVDAFRQVIRHEANHIIQTACGDNEEIGEVELGICHKYEDLKVNPLYWSWFLEAAAEKEMGRILGEETNTYSAPIGYYDSLILCSILNDNVSVSDVEAISFEKKADSLFKAFNATTNEEKLEIIKMMYSIEIMQSQPDDFYKVYKETYGIDLLADGNELENLRLELRIDILKSLSKEFYKSLSYQAMKGNLSLDTIYYLINVYESDVFIHLFYNEKARIASGVEFFDFYTELQNEFFKMIEPSLNYNFDEIVDMFNNYSMNVSYNGNVMKNYNLDLLGEDANFIEKKRIQNYQTGIPPIRSMPEYCKNNGYTK